MPFLYRQTVAALILALLTVSCQTTASRAQLSREPAQVDPKVFRVGMISDAIAMDPHYMFSDLNFQVSKMIYDPLFEFGPHKEIVPLLALKGAQLKQDASLWLFKLKPRVKFHNGQRFNKQDVLCTFDRMESYAPHSPSGFFKNNLGSIDLARTRTLNSAPTKAIKNMLKKLSLKPGPLLLLIATKEPGAGGKPSSYKLLPSNLASTFIMSCADTKRAIQADKSDPNATADKSPATLAAFANGLKDGPNGSIVPLLNGTGPYRYNFWVTLASKEPNPMVELKRFEGYHGKRRAWETVQMIPVTDGNERVDRLLKGDLDFVASVPAPRFKDLEEKAMDQSFPFVTFKNTSFRLIHMQMYHGDDGRQNDARFIPLRTADGRVMPNPFNNPLVRKAFAQAIDKEFLVQDVMGGLAKTSDQYMPDGTIGHINGYKPYSFDIAEARKTLTEAAAVSGYEFLRREKLVLTIHGPSDRYPNGAKALEALAGMWNKAFNADDSGFSIEVKTALEPTATYFANSRKYLIHLIGGGVDNGHVSGAVRLYFLYDKTKLMGLNLNEGNYRNDKVDELYAKGVSEADDKQSTDTLTEALKLAMDDLAILPMYNQMGLWAGKRGLKFAPRLDEATVPDQVGLENQE